jgi:DHA1 family bicyclomycin/chloramphenicol resistance-like MFS transporter
MSRFLLVLLASLTALAPLAIDAYLPAMPEMATGFGVSIHAIELSLSVFLAGFASGQLIGGPLSDYAGRRPTIFTGLVLFIIGTSLVIVASSVELLWAGRFIQAIGGGLAVVNSSAVIRDLSEGKTAARHMGNMMLIMLMAPLLAPMIGSALLHLNGWMLIFEFLLVYAIVIIGCLYVFLPETRKTHTLHLSPYQRYKSVLTNRLALSYIGSQCFAVAAMFASITASPTVFMEFFGISAAIFPLFFCNECHQHYWL